MNVCIDSPRVVGNGKKVNALPRRARLAPSRVPARKTRGRAATRAGPEDQLGTGNGDDLNYNVLAERMKALQAKESADTNEAVDAAIEREQARRGNF